MKRYVVGFMFQNDMVLLIEKNRPEWQAGFFNGIGGHIQDGESPHDAMTREFQEEAGVYVTQWQKYCVLHGSDFEVVFFYCMNTESLIPVSQTDEQIGWHDIDFLPTNTIPNLRWLIPMARTFQYGPVLDHYNIEEKR